MFNTPGGAGGVPSGSACRLEFLPELAGSFLCDLRSLRAPPRKGANPAPSVQLVRAFLRVFLRVSASPRRIDSFPGSGFTTLKERPSEIPRLRVLECSNRHLSTRSGC